MRIFEEISRPRHSILFAGLIAILVRVAKERSGCEPPGGVTLMADNAAVEMQRRELITASANKCCLLTVGG